MENNTSHPVKNVLTRIDDATKRSPFNNKEITLVAVSKTKPIADIVTAYEAGIRHFGENRASELAEKAVALKHLPDIKWHFIGHLQTRQSQPVAEYAHYFHAIDRLKIAQRLSTQLEELKQTLPVFIEVNISGEESKGGFDCSDWHNQHQQYDALIKAVQTIAALPHIQIQGLMTMAPWVATETLIRNTFSDLRQLSEKLNKELPELQATELSMGMSGDFEIAIEEGASCIRVGSAIFGNRG